MFLIARRKMKGRLLRCFARRLCAPLAVFLGLVLLLPAVLCFAYGTPAVLAYAEVGPLPWGWMNGALPFVLLAAGTAALLFAVAFSFYERAWVFYSFDKNQTRPKSLLRPSQAWRYLRCLAGVAARKAGWLLLYLLPAAAPLALLRYGAGSLWMTAAVRFVLTAALSLLLAAGLAFYAVASSRYYMAVYLLYLNPLMPPGEAISSSVRLTEGRLFAVAARRLSLLPWALSELLVLPLPFAAVYRRFCAAALCERLFGEDKRRVPSPAVVFYISRKSKISEAEL